MFFFLCLYESKIQEFTSGLNPKNGQENPNFKVKSLIKGGIYSI